MSLLSRSMILTAAVLMTGCANQPASTSSSSDTANTSANKTTQTSASPAKTKENQPEGEIIGTPAKSSKFAKLQLGHTFREVSDLIGAPDDILRHETGKRWIPYYFGSDAQRLQVLYKSEGCLTYTGGNVFGGGSNKLIRITVDPKGACWKP